MIVLHTPRLTLRWFAAADAPALLALMNDEGWLRYIGDRGVHTVEAARTYIEERLLAPCRAQGFGLWAAERRDGAQGGKAATGQPVRALGGTGADAFAGVAQSATASATEGATEGATTGEFAGMCGLVRREGLPAVDLGFAFLPAHRGQGLAREAAAATLRHAHEVLGQREVLAITHPQNAASAALLRALGFGFVEQRALTPQAPATDIFRWAPPPAP